MAWNPHQYLRFADHRQRPAADLLNRVDWIDPPLVCDLGCGPGNLLPLLRRRWPHSRLVGVDSSPEMLDQARAAHPDGEWVRADIADWWPDRAPEVIFSNAALQWLDGHGTLLPRLFRQLAPGGVLAVQMPRNFDSPSHTAIKAIVYEGPWQARLEPLLRHDPVAAPEVYWDMLAGETRDLDVWEEVYLQALEGEDAVLQWSLGTALRPFLATLEEPWKTQFVEEYRRRMALAYPRRADGVTLFPFRRLFIVAKRP